MFKIFLCRPITPLVMALLLLLAAGCGSEGSGSGTEAGNTEQAAGNNAQTETAANVEAANDTAGADDAPTEEKARKIAHAMGETEVPPRPERVVVLDNGALDNLLALGVKPVGAPSIIAVEDGFASYLTGTEGIANVGTVEQPSLETIASLKPDVIIGIKDTHEAIYEQLSKIAPTVFTEVGGAQWEQNLAIHAAITWKEEEAARLLKELDAHIEELRSKVGDAMETTEVSLLRPRKDRVSVYLKPGFTGGVAEKIGLKRPAAQNRDDDFNFNITEEQIADLDGDVIILFGRESEQDYFNEKIKTNPLWKTLKGVKNNRVYSADWEVWLSGHGIQAVNLMVDDLANYLAK